MTYVMLYGASAGVVRKVGATSLKYPSRAAGTVPLLLVNNSGAWNPRWERMADPTAPCQSDSFTSVNPWPAPVMFHPIIPTGSHIFANASEVVSGVFGGGVLNATPSSSVIRETCPYMRS